MAEPPDPTQPPPGHIPRLKCQGNCPNPVAISSGSKCQDCLDKDTARKQNVTVDLLRERRALALEKSRALIAEGLGRPAAPAGLHHCYGCGKDVPVEGFDLVKSISRCIKHHEQAVAANQARKKAAASSTSNVGQPASAAAAASDAEEDTVVHREVFRTKAAALEFVEKCGHEDHVMYLQAKSDDFGHCTYRCHCSDKPRAPRTGMSYSLPCSYAY